MVWSRVIRKVREPSGHRVVKGPVGHHRVSKCLPVKWGAIEGFLRRHETSELGFKRPAAVLKTLN